jgi:hypothetical protein
MVMPAFHRFPNEAAIIARLLAGYAELEIALLHCVAVATDFNATLKAMFRIRGETARINVGDALGRQVYHKLGLGTDFEMAVGALRYCLKIRNQYAHCNWYDDWSGGLAFVNVEEIAKENQPISRLDARRCGSPFRSMTTRIKDQWPVWRARMVPRQSQERWWSRISR